MTKRELLKRQYDISCNNLLAYSSNYAMTKAKEGYEREWQEAKTECELFDEMVKELPQGENDLITFIGSISMLSIGINPITNERMIENVLVYDKSNNRKLFTIDYEIGQKLLDRYDIEKEERYNSQANTDLIFTVNNFSQRIEKWEWKEI